MLEDYKSINSSACSGPLTKACADFFLFFYGTVELENVQSKIRRSFCFSIGVRKWRQAWFLPSYTRARKWFHQANGQIFHCPFTYDVASVLFKLNDDILNFVLMVLFYEMWLESHAIFFWKIKFVHIWSSAWCIEALHGLTMAGWLKIYLFAK